MVPWHPYQQSVMTGPGGKAGNTSYDEMNNVPATRQQNWRGQYRSSTMKPASSEIVTDKMATPLLPLGETIGMVNWSTVLMFYPTVRPVWVLVSGGCGRQPSATGRWLDARKSQLWRDRAQQTGGCFDERGSLIASSRIL